MNNIRKFSGQPIISQILKFIDPSIISRTAEKHKSDKYYKKFKTKDHLITMLYSVISGVSSLRETTSIILAFEGKIKHLGMDYFPRRSTLSDANKKRSSEVFGDIYRSLYNSYKGFLSDSSEIEPAVKGLKETSEKLIDIGNKY